MNDYEAKKRARDSVIIENAKKYDEDNSIFAPINNSIAKVQPKGEKKEKDDFDKNSDAVVSNNPVHNGGYCNVE